MKNANPYKEFLETMHVTYTPEQIAEAMGSVFERNAIGVFVLKLVGYPPLGLKKAVLAGMMNPLCATCGVHQSSTDGLCGDCRSLAKEPQ